MRRDTLQLLEDIRDAARFIADDTAGATFETFEGDRRTRQLVERNLEIIGEAMRRLTRRDPETAQRITAYAQIIAFRNALVHGYDVIDHVEVLRIIHDSLPVLRAEVEELLGEAKE